MFGIQVVRLDHYPVDLLTVCHKKGIENLTIEHAAGFYGMETFTANYFNYIKSRLSVFLSEIAEKHNTTPEYIIINSVNARAIFTDFNRRNLL